MWSPRRGLFWPQGHTFNKFGRGRGLLSNASHQISRLYACGFRQEDKPMLNM